MINLCKTENVSTKQVFFLLFLAVDFIIMGYLNINVCAGQLMKILGFIFSGDQ